jgi:hypothetical protein
MKAMPNTYRIKDVTPAYLAQAFATLSAREGYELICKLLGEPALSAAEREDYE